MLSGWREKLEDVAARAGLGRVPVPVLGALAALALAGAAWTVSRSAPSAGPEIVEEPTAAVSAKPSAEPSVPVQIVVHVVGAVHRPGVYRLPKGARGEDALRAAGGSLGEADLGQVNLARPLADGEQLAIPVEGQAPPPGPAAGGGGGAGSAGAAGGKVDINRATAEELDALPGVGPSTATKIVTEREANGPYATVEDLMRVPGIGAKKLEALKDLVTAG